VRRRETAPEEPRHSRLKVDEEILVALGASEFVRPDWVRDDLRWQSLMAYVAAADADAARDRATEQLVQAKSKETDEELLVILDRAMLRHRDRWISVDRENHVASPRDLFDSLHVYRGKFIELAAGIRTEEDRASVVDGQGQQGVGAGSASGNAAAARV
jgi:hypothetical protein